jgi:hypothetical protein
MTATQVLLTADPSGIWLAYVSNGPDERADALLGQAGFKTTADIPVAHLPSTMEDGDQLHRVAHAQSLLARAGYAIAVSQHAPARRAIDSAAQATARAAEESAAALVKLTGSHDAALYIAHLAQFDSDLHINPARLLQALVDRLSFHRDYRVVVVVEKLREVVVDMSTLLDDLDGLAELLLEQPDLPLPEHGYRPAPIVAASPPAAAQPRTDRSRSLTSDVGAMAPRSCSPAPAAAPSRPRSGR